MRFVFILIVSGILVTNCTKKNINAPSCILAKIEEQKSRSVRNPPGSVIEYEYQGRKVYLIPADCCDQYDLLFDRNCNLICSPSGGITGSGDRGCTDFYSQAKLIREVWRDPR